MAGSIAVCISFVAVILVLPLLGIMFIRNEETLARDRTPADKLMDGLGVIVGEIVDRVTHRPYLYSTIGVVLFFLFGAAFVDLPTRYRLADQVPDREQALDATSRIDQKLTGANPVHVMIEWTDGTPLYSPKTLDVIGQVHNALEKEAGLGNVWSVESLRRWLREAGDDRIETVEKFVGFLPDHLVRRFIAEEKNAVLVTGPAARRRFQPHPARGREDRPVARSHPRRQSELSRFRSPACRRSPPATARA